MMRLINVLTKRLENFFEQQVPSYAILSHTWGKDELTFEEITTSSSATALHPLSLDREGHRKVWMSCALAIKHGLHYVWVDTCCINKSSSTELTEAINSMFRWYRDAALCFTYLIDLDPEDQIEISLPQCRWFTRGWTLQELIAPKTLEFYDSRWGYRGQRSEMKALLADITGVDMIVLDEAGQQRTRMDVLLRIPVAKKLSWASHRTTTRPEDLAYCLLGIFDISMPMIYGEHQRAFSRLQDEIMRNTNDLSILAWKWSRGEQTNFARVFADWPSDFKDPLPIQSGNEDQEFVITNKGLKLTTKLLKYSPERKSADIGRFCYVLPLASSQEKIYSLALRRIGNETFIRDVDHNGGIVEYAKSEVLDALSERPVYIVTSQVALANATSRYRDYISELIHIRIDPRLSLNRVLPREFWDDAICGLSGVQTSGLDLAFPTLSGGVMVLAVFRGPVKRIYIVPYSHQRIGYVQDNLANLSVDELEGPLQQRHVEFVANGDGRWTGASEVNFGDSQAIVSCLVKASDQGNNLLYIGSPHDEDKVVGVQEIEISYTMK